MHLQKKTVISIGKVFCTFRFLSVLELVTRLVGQRLTYTYTDIDVSITVELFENGNETSSRFQALGRLG